MVQSRCVSLSLVPDTENWAAGACASQHTGRYECLAGKMPARTRQSRPARADGQPGSLPSPPTVWLVRYAARRHASMT